VVHKVNLRL